jgi:hypothetical protein
MTLACRVEERLGEIVGVRILVIVLPRLARPPSTMKFKIGAIEVSGFAQ